MTPTDPSEAQDYLEKLTEGLQNVGALRAQVAALDGHVTISEQTARDAASAAKDAKAAAEKSTTANKTAVIFACVALVATFLAFYSLRQGCLSANASREASAGIWQVVLSAADDPRATKAQRAQAKEFAGYVQAVYRPHNCWLLLKSYPAPAKPDLRSP